MVELAAMNGETSGAERSQTSDARVQSSDSGDQTTRKRVTLNYPEVAAPSMPELGHGRRWTRTPLCLDDGCRCAWTLLELGDGRC